MGNLIFSLVAVLVFQRGSGQEPCDNLYCLNGGECVVSEFGYRSCDCAMRFTGFYCEKSVPDKPCVPSECLNGECPAEYPPHDQTCECEPGFFGPVCDRRTCTSEEDCNGGTCQIDEVEENNICTSCPPGKTGPFCEYDFDSFCRRQEQGICLNGGSCMLGDECTCRPNFAGPLCEVHKLCSYTNRCLNGGRCEQGMCICTEPYEGILCEKACRSNDDCMNEGFCSGKNQCICPEGFTGGRCEIPEECFENSDCFNGGSCYSGQCECRPNFSGQLCTIACSKHVDCRNGGSCDLPSALCSCLNGFIGPHCQKTSPCKEDRECANGGFCLDGLCECSNVFEGPRCEIACENDRQCQNGGICNVDEGLCECVDGFTGQHCQTNAQEPLSVTVIAVSVVAVVILLILVIVLIIMVRRYMKRRRYQKPVDAHQLEMAEKRTSSNDYSENHTGASGSKRNDRMTSEPGDKEFPREQLHIMEQLGAGSFATVHRAEAEGIIKKGIMSTVAVKMLKNTASEGDKKDFEKERQMYISLGFHPNVVTMLGYCTEKEPFFLIMEYLPNGNLQSYLRYIRSENEEQYCDLKEKKTRNFLLPSEVLSFASQIANGMEFLASNSCIHRDLATRNILLGDDLVAKVSDFGLARDVQESSQYEMKSKGRVPVRWMAPESLLDNLYTTKSDVWGFAVLLWELVTLGSHPYPGMSSKQVIDEITAGYRLPKPESCSDDIYVMMKNCWEHKPEYRPTFTEICKILDNMMADANGYLIMSDLNRDDYLYLEPNINTKSINTADDVNEG